MGPTSTVEENVYSGVRVMSIEWPLNEPIETSGHYGMATIHFKHRGMMAGTMERHSDIVVWREKDGKALQWCKDYGGAGDLIPPKREPRTVAVYVNWQAVGGPAICARPFQPGGDQSTHTITHPDDVEPVTERSVYRWLRGEGLDHATSCTVSARVVERMRSYGIEVKDD